MSLETTTGRGVLVAVIDSGVHMSHPHVGGIAGGFGVTEDGATVEDYVDRLGHGTAVAAAIHEKVPDAQILAVKVFWRTLSATVSVLVRAIEEASARGADVINLSLGTTEAQHEERLSDAVRSAAARNSVIVAATAEAHARWLPGSLPEVLGVALDWTCPRESYRLMRDNGRTVVACSGYPRGIPGVDPERNLKGISFAVANATGFVARAREHTPDASVTQVLAILEQVP